MIWTFDPGAVATGVACLDAFEGARWWQFTDPRDAFRTLSYYGNRYVDIVLIEDYSHGGTFTIEAKDTLKTIGYLEYASRDARFNNVILRHKDKRLSGQGPAARLMGDTIPALKKDPKRKDAFSAVAHCVVYKRETDNLNDTGTD